MLMVKKRIIILSLVLLYSGVVRADDDVSGEKLKVLTTDGEGSVCKDRVKAENELGSAGLPRIAVLENALKHFDGSLASEFLSTDARAKINQEIKTHTNLVDLEINALAAQVSDSLKSKDFSAQVVLNVIAECRDLKNREAVVTGALANIAAEIARLNAQAGLILNPSDRAPLNAQRAELEKIEVALGVAKARIVKAVPYAAQASDVTVFWLNPNTHGNILRVALVTGGLATAILLRHAANLFKPE